LFNNASASCSCILNLFLHVRSFTQVFCTSTQLLLCARTIHHSSWYYVFFFLSLSLSLSLLAGRWSFYSLSLLFWSHPLDRLFLDPLEHSRENS
jgi:hypothetical protein